MLNEAKGSHGNFETTLDSASNSSLNSQPVLWAGRERGGVWVLILLADDFIDVWWLDSDGGAGGGLEAGNITAAAHSIYLLSVIAMLCLLLYTATGVRRDNLK